MIRETEIQVDGEASRCPRCERLRQSDSKLMSLAEVARGQEDAGRGLSCRLKPCPSRRANDFPEEVRYCTRRRTLRAALRRGRAECTSWHLRPTPPLS